MATRSGLARTIRLWRRGTDPLGGSNGGLLIANMLTRYPERFGALYCAVPVTDMRRFAKLLIGPALIDEFGDPGRPRLGKGQ
jgi:prolyl oligopeptidase PreP (S9A serine peptidase family)